MGWIRQVIISAALIALLAAAWFVFGGAITGEDGPPAGPATAERGAGAGAGAGGSGGPAAGQPGGGRPGGGRPGGGGPGGFGRGPTLVVTAEVTAASTGFEVRAVGTAEAAQAVTLFPEVGGVVEEILLTSGAHVERGDPLVRLASAEAAIALEGARFAHEAAAEALDRAERLAASNNISAVALTDARAAAARTEIDVRAAELDLAKRTVRAPFAGIVGMIDLVPGDLVSSSRAVATLDDLSSASVTFDVPERATGLVEIGQPLTATAEALPGSRFEGAISELDSRVDPVSRTLRVRALLPNDDERLRPGMALVVTLAFPGEATPQVPSLAIQWDRDGPFVWKVVDGAARRAGVDIAARRSGWVAVVGEVEAGDDVVVEGLQRLREGGPVRTAGGDGRPGRDGPPADRGGEGGGERRPPAVGAADAAERPAGRRPPQGGG